VEATELLSKIDRERIFRRFWKADDISKTLENIRRMISETKADLTVRPLSLWKRLRKLLTLIGFVEGRCDSVDCRSTVSDWLSI
jgi:hypothetical protein